MLSLSGWFVAYRGEKAAPSVTQVAWIYSWIDVLGLLESVITIYLVLIEFLRRRRTSHRTNGLCSLSFTQRCWSASLSSQSQVCGFSATRSANSYHQSDSTIRLFYTPMLPYQFSRGWCRYTLTYAYPKVYSLEKVYCCSTISKNRINISLNIILHDIIMNHGITTVCSRLTFAVEDMISVE